MSGNIISAVAVATALAVNEVLSPSEPNTSDTAVTTSEPVRFASGSQPYRGTLDREPGAVRIPDGVNLVRRTSDSAPTFERQRTEPVKVLKVRNGQRDGESAQQYFERLRESNAKRQAKASAKRRALINEVADRASAIVRMDAMERTKDVKGMSPVPDAEPVSADKHALVMRAISGMREFQNDPRSAQHTVLDSEVIESDGVLYVKPNKPRYSRAGSDVLATILGTFRKGFSKPQGRWTSLEDESVHIVAATDANGKTVVTERRTLRMDRLIKKVTDYQTLRAQGDHAKGDPMNANGIAPSDTAKTTVMRDLQTVDNRTAKIHRIHTVVNRQTGSLVYVTSGKTLRNTRQADVTTEVLSGFEFYSHGGREKINTYQVRLSGMWKYRVYEPVRNGDGKPISGPGFTVLENVKTGSVEPVRTTSACKCPTCVGDPNKVLTPWYSDFGLTYPCWTKPDTTSDAVDVYPAGYFEPDTLINSSWIDARRDLRRRDSEVTATCRNLPGWTKDVPSRVDTRVRAFCNGRTVRYGRVGRVNTTTALHEGCAIVRPQWPNLRQHVPSARPTPEPVWYTWRPGVTPSHPDFTDVCKPMFTIYSH